MTKMKYFQRLNHHTVYMANAEIKIDGIENFEDKFEIYGIYMWPTFRLTYDILMR